MQKQVRFTGTFSELAIHYFSDLNIKSIFLLKDNIIDENKYRSLKLIKLYRISPEEQRKYELVYNIRAVYHV